MRRSTGTGTVLAAAAIVLLVAATSRAGAPTRLAIELPPDVTFVEPGGRVDVVQVVGIDADGRRVGFAGATPVVTVSVGRIESVAPPYRFAFTAPPKIDGPLSALIEAHLPDAPEVRGTLRLDVWPRGPYVRLRLDAATERVAWGGIVEVGLRGETRDGRVVPVADRRVKVTLRGPGKLEFLRLGRYRYAAPQTPDAAGRSGVTLHAVVASDAAVHGKLPLWLGPRASGRAAGERPSTEKVGAGRPPGSSPTSERTPRGTAGTAGRDDGAAQEPAPHGEQPAIGTTKPPEKRPEAGDEAPRSTRNGVAWPGGRLLLTAWRVHALSQEGETSRRVRRLPQAGAEFVAREALQRLRFVVLDDTVTGVTAVARRGAADGDVDEQATDLKLKRNKAGKLTLVLESRPPEDGTPLYVTLRLERAAGAPSRDVVVLRRRTSKPRR